MKLSDAVTWMRLHAPAVVAFLKSTRAVSTVDMAEGVTLAEVREIGRAFSNHTRVIILTVTPAQEGKPESISLNMLGNWDGRLMQVADKVFSNCFDRYKSAVRAGLEEVSFRSMPSPEELKVLKEKDRLAQLAELHRRKQLEATQPELMQELKATEMTEEVVPDGKVLTYGGLQVDLTSKLQTVHLDNDPTDDGPDAKEPKEDSKVNSKVKLVTPNSKGTSK